MLNISGPLSNVLNAHAELDAFAHAIAASFATNLFYTVLFKFGKISGASLDRRIEVQRLRVLPAVAESRSFDSRKFSASLDLLKRRCLRAIAISNFFIVTWAVLAGVVGIFFLIYLGFFPKHSVIGETVIYMCLFLFGAVPIGLLFCSIVHIVGWARTRYISHEANVILKHYQNAPSQELAKAKAALKTARKRT